VLVGIALPNVRRLTDRIAARGAAGDAAETLELARQLAMVRGARSTVAIDTSADVLTLVVGADTITRRDVRREHGAHLHTSRTSTTYTPLGIALGVSNLTLVATRGAAAESVTVSRLGRVRW
jgi:Tfp pilus assembly protein FimT